MCPTVTASGQTAGTRRRRRSSRSPRRASRPRGRPSGYTTQRWSWRPFSVRPFPAPLLFFSLVVFLFFFSFFKKGFGRDLLAPDADARHLFFSTGSVTDGVLHADNAAARVVYYVDGIRAADQSGPVCLRYRSDPDDGPCLSQVNGGEIVLVKNVRLTVHTLMVPLFPFFFRCFSLFFPCFSLFFPFPHRSFLFPLMCEEIECGFFSFNNGTHAVSFFWTTEKNGPTQGDGLVHITVDQTADGSQPLACAFIKFDVED